MKRCMTIILIIAYCFSLLPSCFAAEPVITGEITAVSGDEITLDIGLDSGVREGAEGIVYYQRTVGGQSVRLTVARVKVVSVSAGAAKLRIIEQTAEIKTGYPVEIQVLTVSPAPPPKGKTKWYVAGAIIAGGAIYYILSMIDNEKEKDGSAVITVTFPE